MLDAKSRTELARLSIFHTKEAGNTLIVTVPFNVLLDPGIGISLGNDKPRVYPFETCNGVGCIVRIKFDEDLQKAIGDGGGWQQPGTHPVRRSRRQARRPSLFPQRLQRRDRRHSRALKPNAGPGGGDSGHEIPSCKLCRRPGAEPSVDRTGVRRSGTRRRPHGSDGQTKPFGDWTVRCFPVKSPSPCDMFELLANKKDTRQRVMSVSIAYLPANDRHVIQIAVPLLACRSQRA